MLLVALLVLQVVVLALVAFALARGPAADPLAQAQAARVEASVAQLGAQVGALHGQLAGTAQGLTTAVQSVREDSRALVGERFDLVRAELATTLGEMRREVGGAVQAVGTGLAAQIEAVRDESRKAIEERFGAVHERIARQLGEIREGVEARLGQSLDKSAAVFKDVSDRLGDLKVTNERIMGFSRDLNELQSLLQSPKLRGNLGEFALDQMLSQVLPADGYELQASLGGRERVDAVITLKQGKLSIDSKFPLEAWRQLQNSQTPEDEARARKQLERDVKIHVESIAAKYIVPEVTLDFALMFIPAESVWAEIVRDSALLEFSLALGVVPVSPTTLYAHLQVIALGFRGMKIEDEARRVERILGELKRSFDAFKGHFEKVGKHLDNARTQFDVASKDVNRFDQTIGGLRLGDLDEADTLAQQEQPPTALLPANKAA